MELLPPPDFFDSIDFNILSAEIFHTQEHDYDETITEPNEALQSIENGGAHEVKEKGAAKTDEEEVPTRDD
jgi:hypothetical protein